MRFNIFITAMLRVAVERFGASADVVKDMVCTNKVIEKRRGGQKLERPEKGRDDLQETVEEPKPIWGMLLCRRRGHRFEVEEQPCKDDDSYRYNVHFVRI